MGAITINYPYVSMTQLVPYDNGHLCCIALTENGELIKLEFDSNMDLINETRSRTVLS